MSVPVPQNMNNFFRSVQLCSFGRGSKWFILQHCRFSIKHDHYRAEKLEKLWQRHFLGDFCVPKSAQGQARYGCLDLVAATGAPGPERFGSGPDPEHSRALQTCPTQGGTWLDY